MYKVKSYTVVPNLFHFVCLLSIVPSYNCHHQLTMMSVLQLTIPCTWPVSTIAACGLHSDNHMVHFVQWTIHVQLAVFGPFSAYTTFVCAECAIYFLRFFGMKHVSLTVYITLYCTELAPWLQPVGSLALNQNAEHWTSHSTVIMKRALRECITLV